MRLLSYAWRSGFVFKLFVFYLCCSFGGAEGYVLKWDQTLGPTNGVNPTGLYSDLLQMMQAEFGLNVSIIPQNSLLGSQNWEGVGLLWVEAKHSGNPGDGIPKDAQVIYDFTRVRRSSFFLFFFSPPLPLFHVVFFIYI